MLESSNPSVESNFMGLEFLPNLGGFYISAIEPFSTFSSFPRFPPVPVKVVRIQVMRIASLDPRGAWWKGIEWVVEMEKWVKLKRE
ncbi:MAG: hypothetical protein N2442_13280 [Spirochaetes bacterium]|nr:hypothetical protein [Spirochaetota bacterium]